MWRLRYYSSLIKKIILALVLAALGFAGIQLLIWQYMSDDSKYEISGLKLSQDRFALEAEWDDAGCDSYNVMVFSGVGRPYNTKVDEPDCRIENIKIGEKYTVIVTAVDDEVSGAGAQRKTLRTKKIDQQIRLSENEFEGFAKDKFTLKVKARGQISFRSSRSSTAEVTENGRIIMKKPGTAYVTVKASGNDNFKSAKTKVLVKVYPGELNTPILKLAETTGTTATLSWTSVSLAKKYILLKYDHAKEKYMKFREFKANETGVELVRDQAKYKIRAVTEVNGKTVDSPASKSVAVYSTAKDAETYSSAKNIMTLDNSNMSVVTMITGSGSIKVPQSMSFNGKEYIVAYVNKAGTEGAFFAYGRDGEYKRGELASNMGHANGSTYNPNTGKIYVAKTHKSFRTNSCSSYNEKDFSGSDIFNLPKQTSGMAYDESNNKFYLSKGNEIYVCDDKFNVEKFIWKSIRYNHAQDIGAYNGVALVCTWVSGKESYIDMYRTSDGKYLGSYYVPIGEIESVVVDDGYLVILMNIQNTNKDYIYRTNERVAIP